MLTVSINLGGSLTEVAGPIEEFDFAARLSRSREAPINLPHPSGELKIPRRSALIIAKRPVRTDLSGFSAHVSMLSAQLAQTHQLFSQPII